MDIYAGSKHSKVDTVINLGEKKERGERRLDCCHASSAFRLVLLC
jgi:hypothetical protein